MIDDLIRSYDKQFDSQKNTCREFLEAYKFHQYEKMNVMLINSSFLKEAFIDGSNLLIYDFIVNNNISGLEMLYKHSQRIPVFLTTCILFGVSEQKIDVVRFTLDKNIDLKKHSEEALLRLAGNGNVEIMKLLLQHGAVLHTQSSEKLSTNPFYHAIYNGHSNMVEFLLPFMKKIHFDEHYMMLGIAKNEKKINSIIKSLIELEEKKYQERHPIINHASSIAHNAFKTIFSYIQTKQTVHPDEKNYNVFEKMLKQSSYYGNIEMVEFFINKGIDKNIVYLHGNEKSKEYMVNVNRRDLAEKLDNQCIDHTLVNSSHNQLSKSRAKI